MSVRAKWAIGAAATLVGYLAGTAAGHVIFWGARRADEHLARITDLGGD